MSSAQVTEKAPVRTWLVVVLLVLAAVVGAGTALFNYAFNVEYGPTTGSWMDGAVAGLTGTAVPLTWPQSWRRSRSSWDGDTGPVGAGAGRGLVVLSAGGVFVGGGQAAVVKNPDRLAKVPYCGTSAEGSPAGALAASAEFARLEHPEPFGGGWYGVDGCGAVLLNATFAEAAAHYRERLPAAGWTIAATPLRIGGQPWRSDICSDRHLRTGRNRDQADQRRTKSKSLLTSKSIVDPSATAPALQADWTRKAMSSAQVDKKAPLRTATVVVLLVLAAVVGPVRLCSTTPSTSHTGPPAAPG